MTKQKKSKVFNIILWIFQALLAVTFIWGGGMKLFQPNDLPWLWVNENPELVTVSGVFDLLAGFGLTLPSLLRIQPKMTIYAAYGTIALMISASIFHIIRGEGNQIGFNIFILISAIFIAWGRLKKAPIEPKK
ncbi:DoxX family protein [Flavivirga sp. 57AJ16]|uniref:DoxX family protein n=1 Tax=Flavivirga sp. 57AJ16 TaxID=3025307 RepID=UPI002365493C|nr:DoxX family protein [Flavivirga sp. 57AJ16]MDD7886010.1 DoxX family protein [Flavivirga sp. 57AJ16]